MADDPKDMPVEEQYQLFAQQYVKWTAKPPVRGLRDMIGDEYPDARQVERDQLALLFLIFEMFRYILPPEDASGKEPWQM